MVGVISVDTYHFLTFSDLTCHLEDTGIGVFWLHCAAWYEETELGSSDLEAFPSAGKSTGVVSVPYSLMEVFLFPVVWIFLRSLGVICYDRWFLSESHKNYFKDWCLMNSKPTFLFLTDLNLIMAILSKACKPDNFESHNSLKRTFTNVRGLRSDFVDCKSFLESNSPDILALCETNLVDSIDSGNFSVRGYFPLILILILICLVLQFMFKDFFLHGTYL